ncbi:MAG TPA: hypothetical protein VG407_17915 [Caulobacteraceae bacterium]|jgi:hypothetical protein|nr:hypothetical protein [Caulobacteraceae bacterium]
MSDLPEDAVAPNTSETAPLRKAQVGVVDKGEVVGTALDQPVSGIIADIADGDDHHHKK